MNPTQTQPIVPPDIAALRAKYGIPATGVTKPTVAPQNTADRLTEVQNAWKANSTAPAEPQDEGVLGKILGAPTELAKGVLKGAGSTIRGLGELGTKAGDLLSEGVEKLGGPKYLFHGSDIYRPETETGQKVTDALDAKGVLQNIGKAGEQIAEFFLPAGQIAEVEKVLAGGAKAITAAKLAPIVGDTAANILSHAASLGTKMAVRATEGGGVIGIQTGGDPAAVKAGAITGGAFSGLTSAISPALSKILSPFTKSFDPATADLFKSEGIKPPISAISKNEGVRLLEATGSKTLFGKKIAQTAEKAVDSIDTKTNQIIDNITPKKGMSDQDLGKMLKAGLNEFETHFKQTEEKVYESFSKKYGMAPARPLDTQNELASILAQKGESVFGSIDPKLKIMFEKISDETPEMKATIKEMYDKHLPEETIQKEISKIKEENPPKEMTFNQLKATRTDVGEALAKDPENTSLKRLYGALSRDMQETVNFNKEGAVELSKLNAKYAAGKDKLESRIAQSMVQSNPEKIAGNLLQRDSADAINSLKEMVGPDRFKEVTRHFVRNLVESGKTEGGKFKIEKLKNALGEYDQQTLDAILSPEEQKGLKDGITHLENLELLSKATKSGAKAAQGSQTAFLVNSGASATALTTGITAALMSGNFTILGALTAKIGGEYALAKFIASDAGRKILTEGINPDNIKLLRNLAPTLRSFIIESVGKSNQEN